MDSRFYLFLKDCESTILEVQCVNWLTWKTRERKSQLYPLPCFGLLERSLDRDLQKPTPLKQSHHHHLTNTPSGSWALGVLMLLMLGSLSIPWSWSKIKICEISITKITDKTSNSISSTFKHQCSTAEETRVSNCKATFCGSLSVFHDSCCACPCSSSHLCSSCLDLCFDFYSFYSLTSASFPTPSSPLVLLSSASSCLRQLAIGIAWWLKHHF